jgi:LuxR family maltose regulon positive regulatory protein
VDRPFAWLSLDEGDNDPARFLAYLIAALQMIHADAGQAARTMLQSPQPPPLESVLTTLINEITTSWEDDPLLPKAGFALVLDDYHLISALPVHDAVTFFLDHLPPQMHLVILTRADPPLPLARLRARNQLTEIRADHLRFTADEATVFLNQVMGLELSAEDIAALETRTEGWIAGLQLAALSMQGRSADQWADFISAFTGSHHYIVDYLAEEVLNLQPDPVREFLLRTSILDRMTGPLCDALTGCADGQATLEQLEQANLFLIPLDEERRWYRYHHLFADVLRRSLGQTDSDCIPSLHRRASQWFERQHFADEAIGHAFAAQDVERAAVLVEQNALEMINRSELAALFRWLRALPEDVVHSRPWLCVFVAWGKYWVGPRDETDQYVELAEQALDAVSGLGARERDHIAGHIAAIRAFKAAHDEDVPRIFDMSQKAIALVPEWDYVAGLSALILGFACWGRGDAIGAERAFRQGRTIAIKINHPTHAISCAGYEAIQQVKQARLHEAAQTLHEALRLAVHPDGREISMAGFAYLRLGDLAREWNDLEAADQHLDKAVKMCSQSGFSDAVSDAYVALARLRLAQNDLPSAREALAKAEQVVTEAQVDPVISCWLDECWIRLWLKEDDLAAASEWAERCGMGPDDPFRYLRDLDHINLARVWVAQGMQESPDAALSEALKLLDRLRHAAESAGWIHETIKILLLQALAFQAVGNGERALGALSQALALAEPAGYVRIFIDEDTPMARLLRLAESRGIAPKYVAKLLSEFDRKPGATSITQQTLIEPLSERELEVLRLIAAGLSNRKIAEKLVLAVGTVKAHTSNIYDKLGVRSRTQAVAHARELKLI